MLRFDEKYRSLPKDAGGDPGAAAKGIGTTETGSSAPKSTGSSGSDFDRNFAAVGSESAETGSSAPKSTGSSGTGFDRNFAAVGSESAETGSSAPRSTGSIGSDFDRNFAAREAAGRGKITAAFDGREPEAFRGNGVSADSIARESGSAVRCGGYEGRGDRALRGAEFYASAADRVPVGADPGAGAPARPVFRNPNGAGPDFPPQTGPRAFSSATEAAKKDAKRCSHAIAAFVLAIAAMLMSYVLSVGSASNTAIWVSNQFATLAVRFAFSVAAIAAGAIGIKSKYKSLAVTGLVFGCLILLGILLQFAIGYITSLKLS